MWWDLSVCGGVNFFVLYLVTLLGISMNGKNINPKFGWNESILIKKKRSFWAYATLKSTKFLISTLIHQLLNNSFGRRGRGGLWFDPRTKAKELNPRNMLNPRYDYRWNGLLVERNQLGLQPWRSEMATFPRIIAEVTPLKLLFEVTKVPQIVTSSLT